MAQEADWQLGKLFYIDFMNQISLDSKYGKMFNSFMLTVLL